MTEAPLLIKKYSNRKLYDLSRRCYITLEEIARLIREGKQVKVVNSTSNQDLTTVTLAQIILDEEKKRRNLLPVSFLHQLIQYGESLRGSWQQHLSSSLEAVLATQAETGKLWTEWAMREWMPPDRKFDQGRTTAREHAEGHTEDALKAELESVKEKLQQLEEKIRETEKEMTETA
ncbi:MAG: hypothetical protein FVQ06_00215 [candidate division NC10 bacterium]|nr:hypothetical protein [candidate division NC10 bacterium]